MKIFEQPNLITFRCPICGTNDKKPVTLVPIYGTEKDGMAQAIQVHVDCLELKYQPLKSNDGEKLVSITHMSLEK